MTKKETKKEQEVTLPIKLDNLYSIRETLRNVLLPVKGTGLNYAITKNLVKIDGIIKIKEEQIDILKKKYLHKDDDGNPIQYAYQTVKNSDGNSISAFKLDTNGNFIAVDKAKDKNIPTGTMIHNTDPEYIKGMEELLADVDIIFHKFDDSEIKKCYDDGLFDGLDLTPLVGYLFEL